MAMVSPGPSDSKPTQLRHLELPGASAGLDERITAQIPATTEARAAVAASGEIAAAPAVAAAAPGATVAAEQPVPSRIVLALEGVTKSYANGKIALRDVDLAIPEGDFVFLVGPSGAGKSTVIKLLIREEKATKGTVLLDGRDLARLKRREVPAIRRKVGIVFQDFKLLPHRTVAGNVAFALEVTGRPRREIEPAVNRVLRIVGLAGQADQLPSQLSGGELQRTAIARALVNDPRIFIADEPTGNLDPLISWEITQLLLRINEMGVTVLMATHNADVVTALRKRVVALHDGRIVRDETAAAYQRED